MSKRKQAPRNIMLHLLLMVATVLCVGIARFLYWQYQSSLRGPMGLFGIPLVLCPFLGLVGLFVVLCTFLMGWSYHQTKSSIPTLVLAVGLFLVFQLPLPSVPTPETLHFWAHRGDYEAVVEMVRQKDLVSSGCRNGYSPPLQLRHVSAKNCLSVFQDEEDGLQVQFYPLESFDHSIHYTDVDDGSDPCFVDALIEEKIDEHWYVCEETWN